MCLCSARVWARLHIVAFANAKNESELFKMKVKYLKGEWNIGLALEQKVGGGELRRKGARGLSWVCDPLSGWESCGVVIFGECLKVKVKNHLWITFSWLYYTGYSCTISAISMRLATGKASFSYCYYSCQAFCACTLSHLIWTWHQGFLLTELLKWSLVDFCC